MQGPVTVKDQGRACKTRRPRNSVASSVYRIALHQKCVTERNQGPVRRYKRPFICGSGTYLPILNQPPMKSCRGLDTGAGVEIAGAWDVSGRKVENSYRTRSSAKSLITMANVDFGAGPLHENTPSASPSPSYASALMQLAAHNYSVGSGTSSPWPRVFMYILCTPSHRRFFSPSGFSSIHFVTDSLSV